MVRCRAAARAAAAPAISGLVGSDHARYRRGHRGGRAARRTRRGDERRRVRRRRKYGRPTLLSGIVPRAGEGAGRGCLPVDGPPSSFGLGPRSGGGARGGMGGGFVPSGRTRCGGQLRRERRARRPWRCRWRARRVGGRRRQVGGHVSGLGEGGDGSGGSGADGWAGRAAASHGDTTAPWRGRAGERRRKRRRLRRRRTAVPMSSRAGARRSRRGRPPLRRSRSIHFDAPSGWRRRWRSPLSWSSTPASKAVPASIPRR